MAEALIERWSLYRTVCLDESNFGMTWIIIIPSLEPQKTQNPTNSNIILKDVRYGHACIE